MTPQELKNSILQLAIQGKLVEQRAEEGTAAELVEKILAAKNAKDAEKGKGKGRLTRSRGVRGGGEKGELSKLPEAAKSQHSNTLSALSASPREEIPDDEKPFDIPDSWEWVRLGEVGSLTRGSGIKRTETRESGYPCIRYGELYTTYKIRFSITKSFVDEPLYDNSKKISNGDIVMTLTGENKTDIATAVVYEGQDEIAMGGDMTCWSHHGMESLYLVYLMNSPYAISCKRKLATGDIIVHISNEKLSSILLPLPPLVEQKRIVAKIEELMPLVERYEKAWSKLKDFKKSFPVDMQKSILQMAIQGKLVEQRAEEGTGRELLEKILAAKNAKDAEKGKGKGRLTRSRGERGAAPTSAPSASPRDEIPDDEKPFEIPENWEWVRWGDLSQSIQYGYNASAKKAGRIKMVRISDIQGGQVLWDTVPYCEINEKDIEPYLLQENDILFARTGGTVGKSFLVKDLPVDAVYAGYLIRTRYSSELSPEYMKYFMESPLYWEQLKNGTIATAQPNCNGKTLARMLLPLPPLAEQKRIVAKLEELLPLCERLK